MKIFLPPPPFRDCFNLFLIFLTNMAVSAKKNSEPFLGTIFVTQMQIYR